MIYLDSAATSLQKPRGVEHAVVRAMRSMASPGRGGHSTAMMAADTVFTCRQELSKLFGVENPEKVVFVSNATHALNLAIFSLVKQGDPVVISGYEHNAVVRPLASIGARVLTAEAPLFEPDAMVATFRRLLPLAKVAVCTHVSNVFGYILPIEKIAALCQEYRVPLIVDASQSAGSLPIDFQALGAEFLAMPGHKGLLGPQGTGVLICKNNARPLLYGGTGSNSIQSAMPDFLPDRLEAGTHNVAGISGLLAGVRYIQVTTPATILAHERGLMRKLAANLRELPQLELFLSEDPALQSGVLSFRSTKINCETIAETLDQYGIAVRAGLHCAPLAHRTASTLETGTVRCSISPFNTSEEIHRASEVMKQIL
ncbi:MAG: aminotransferase class V-fold PLP-dependent enzyme [Oscillospiraceae bacterium]|jgi:cysteine desulfurase family protein